MTVFAKVTDEVKGPRPTEYSVDWSNPGKAVSVSKDKNEFKIVTAVKGKNKNLYLSFPNEGGIRLRTDEIGIFTPSGLNEIKYAAGSDVKMTAGDTVAAFKQTSGGWALKISNKAGKVILEISNKQIAFGYIGNELKKVKLENPIYKNETIYGTGERFNSFNQVGNELLLWNLETMYHDSYHDENYNPDRSAAYKNVPILHSNRGYTLFFNSAFSAKADIGKTDKQKYTLDFNGPKFDVYIWTNTPLKNLEGYTSLTGKPFLPPKWAFGYWSGTTTQGWNDKNAGGHYNVLSNMMQKYEDLGTIPAAVYGEWYPAEDPKSYTLLNKYGSKMLTWNYPDKYFNRMGETVEIEYGNDYPVVKNLNNPWISEVYLDYTHPNINDYLKNFYSKYFTWGLRGSMLDFGEYIREDMKFANGMTGEEMHNHYSYYYAKAFYDAWSESVGNDFITFQRSGSAGSQAFAANFSGDQAANWSGLKEQILGILSLSASGFSVWGGDIGGVLGTPTNELYIRWMQFASFSPLMRAHGTPVIRDPWNFGEEAEKAFKFSYWVRESLKDTLYSAAIRANKTGHPMVNSMALAFPNERNIANSQDQYLFCDDFLVAPIITSGAYYRDVELPKGNWYSLWTGEKILGGQKTKVDAPMNRIPVFVRQGTATPILLSRETFELSDSISESDGAKALLVTPSQVERSSVQWTDEKTSATYTNTPVKGGYKITNKQGSDTEIILAAGTAAIAVKVDGTPLERFEYREDVLDYEGFYVDGSNKTIINLGQNSWNTIEIISGMSEEYKVLVKDSENSAGISSLINKNEFNPIRLGTSSDYALEIELNKVVPVNNLVMKWSPLGYASKYVVEFSEDGDYWETYGEITEGEGGVEMLRADGVYAKYLRVSQFERNSTTPMMLYGIQVMGAPTAGYPSPDPLPEDNDDVNFDDEDEEEDGTDTETDNSSEDEEAPANTDSKEDNDKPAAKKSGVWKIVLASVLGALAVGAGVFAVIRFRKKK